MMWFRRTIAFGLIFVSLVLFIPTLLLTELNNTAANPDFYNDQLEEADIYNFFYDDALPAAFDEMEEDDSSDMPVDMEDFKADFIAALEEIFPPEWLQEQFESATGELIPYFRGSSDEFTINIQVMDKVDPTAEAIIEIFGVQETYDYLMEEIITPMVMEELGEGVDLPFQVSLSQEEMSNAIKEILPPDWIEDCFEEVVLACAEYAKGAEDISVDISLIDNKAEASSNLTSLADQKLEDRFNSLPEVSPAEFAIAIIDLPSGSIPDVRPEGVSYEDFKTAIGLDIEYWIDLMVIDQIPDQWTLTQEDVMAALGSDLEDTLNDVRDNIATGYTITEQDLRDEMADGDVNPDDLDQVREVIDTGRTWLWVLWVLPMAMLIGAGLLMAKSLRGKILWFLGSVFVMFLIFYVAVGVGYFHYAEPETQTVLAADDYEGFDAVMVDKGNEIVDNALDTYFSGIQNMCLYTMLGCGLVGIAYVGVDLGLRRRNKGKDLPEENNPVSQDDGEAVLLDENGEVLENGSEDTLPEQSNEMLQDENSEILQSDNEDFFQDETGDAMLNENTDFSQDEEMDMLSDDTDEFSQEEKDNTVW